MVGVLVLWSAFLTVWLTLYWVILPHIDEWRPSIEKLASESLGLKLGIGAIHVRSSGWVPALELRDVRLHDSDGNVALRLERVHTALAPQSLLAFRLQFDQILVEGARLEVRRDVQGDWHVAGQHWTGSIDSDDTAVRDWVLRQHEIIVRHAELHFIDERGGVPPLVLSQLDFVLRNGLRGHALRLDATPPPAWGQRFSVRGRFQQPLFAPVGELRRWSGTLYAEFPQADAAALRRHVTLPIELGDGDGALRAWIDIADGSPRHATLDFALQTVSMQLAPALLPLQLQQLRGRVDVRRDVAGIDLRIDDLAFLTHDGLDWPAGDLTMSWRQRQDLGERWTTTTPVTGGEASAERLNLEVLASLAERAPLGDALRMLLGGLAPRGTVEHLKARWSGALDQPSSYHVEARLRDLNLQPAAHPPQGGHEMLGRPGVRGAQIDFSANELGGGARLAIRTGAMTFPGLWEQPEVALDTLDAALSWRIVPQPGRASAIELKLDKISLANADLQAEAEATWHSGDGEGVGRGGRFPGRLDLNAKVARARAASAARYLPLGIPVEARHHVRDAVRGGQIRSATFRVKGDLWDFPFQSTRNGELRIVLQVKDVAYAYLPAPWPVVEQASGEIEFNRLAMHLRRLDGRMWGYELRDVQGGIDDLSDMHPVLALQGNGRGPVSDVLRFTRLAPLGPRVGAALESVAATGPSELKLATRIPLTPDAPVSLQGTLHLTGNELRVHPDIPPLLAARGNVEVSPQGLAVRALTARWMGGETSFDGSVATDGSLRLSAQGVATAEALRATSASRLGALLRGQAAWRGTLHLAEGRRDLQLQSNLVGMQIDLPAPLSKAATAPLPLRLRLSPLPDAQPPAGRERDQLQFELGDLLKAQFQRELTGAEPRVLRGSVAVLEALPALPPSGVLAALKLGRVDLDAWQAVAERSGGSGDVVASGYLPQTLRLRADELRMGGRSLSQVQATLTNQGVPVDPLWRANVVADQLAGDLEYRVPLGNVQAARLMARLQRLSVPQSEVAAVEGLLGQPPASVPALDIVVDDFELRGRKLGRLQVLAVNRPLSGPPGLREWQLDRLELVVPEAQLKGTGRWAPTGARRMALDFSLDLADSGAFIERLGAGKALRGGKGVLTGQLSWAGSPLTLDYPSLEGRLRVDVGDGQFLNVEPGSARLLGVLSLQALPRRLALDFRDLFQEGFAFDGVDGDVKVERGVAHTDNLRMRGVQAMVLMQGSADLLHETQDLRVLVVPNIDATGAALATMVINPAIGLGTLLAQWALREPLIAANTSELHITGSWADPNVRRIPRGADAGAPAPGAATPAEKRPPG